MPCTSITVSILTPITGSIIVSSFGRALDLRLDSVAVELPATASEDDARRARFAVFEAQLEAGELLLLAQHLDDQLETLLLRLMRGAGPGGLAGMPRSACAGRRSSAAALAGAGMCRRCAHPAGRPRDLGMIPTPRLTSIGNYCRHVVLPKLEQRWPDYRESWQKSQALLRESDQLISDLAGLDLAKVAGDKPGIVKLEPLQALSAATTQHAALTGCSRRWVCRR